jgi:hypothetical protein
VAFSVRRCVDAMAPGSGAIATPSSAVRLRAVRG